jgi:hypothetical protein
MALTNAEFAEKYFPKFGSRLDEVREQSKQDFLADLAEHDEDKRIELSEQLKSENPYPDTVFLPISEKEMIRVAQYLKGGGFSPDALFGHWGRTVWDNCAERLMNF